MNYSLLTSEKPLRVKVEKIENNLVKLVFSDHQTVEINAKFLPEGAKPGDQLYLNLLSESDLNLARGEIAKEVLKEILG
jgi:hypothetical protein